MSKPEWMPQRLYQWTKPRSLLLHVLYAIVAAGCGIAGWWQVHRAMQGNTLSYLYSIEWPAIAVVVGIGWWQLVHDTPEDIAGRTEYHRRMRQASAEVVARTLPRSALALTVTSQEVEGRAIGAGATRAVTSGPSGRAGAPAGLTTSGSDGRDLDGSAPGTGLPGHLVPAATHPAVVTAGELDTRLLGPDEGDADAVTDELTEYNRYLATLAVKGRPKTWRNPHGL